MQQPTLKDIIAAWETRKQDQSPTLLAVSIQTIQLLAQGQPVTKAKIQAQSSFTNDEVTTYFNHLEQAGCEFDNKGWSGMLYL